MNIEDNFLEQSELANGLNFDISLDIKNSTWSDDEITKNSQLEVQQVTFNSGEYQVTTSIISDSTFSEQKNIIELGNVAQRIINSSRTNFVSKSNYSELRQGGEPNDTFETAVATNLSSRNQSYQANGFIGNGSSSRASEDIDLFLVELNAGDRLRIDVDTPGFSNLDSVLGIFSSSGELVASNDDRAAPGERRTTDSYLDFTADGNDTYYVGVASYNSNSTGQYSLAIDLETNTTSPPDPNPDSGFDIEVNFTDNNLTASQRAIFADAAAKWSRVITGDLPDVNVPGFGFVDDLVINASAPFIDGNGGTLGQAGPRTFRSGSGLPSSGIMQFDSADVAQLERSGGLEDVIVHEMGHVLGIGTIWRSKGLLTGAGTSDPRFTGRGATAEYNRIFGRNESSVPVANTGGGGTRDAHWRESVFQTELMTGFLNSGSSNPLSRMTVASLGDLGYEVNLNAADPYSAPRSIVVDTSTDSIV